MVKTQNDIRELDCYLLFSFQVSKNSSFAHFKISATGCKRNIKTFPKVFYIHKHCVDMGNTHVTANPKRFWQCGECKALQTHFINRRKEIENISNG